MKTDAEIRAMTDAELQDYISSDFPPNPLGGEGGSDATNGPNLARTTAVQLFYPEIRAAKEQRRAVRIMKRHKREGVTLEDRKQYVRLPKKLQMWGWLTGMEKSFPIMRGPERDFCEQLLSKFRKYTPYAVKWVTRKQYEWLLWISAQYLQVPK